MKSELHKKIREENYAIRFLVYIVGLFIMTLGISLSVKSNLGVSPVSSIPYTITCITGLEMGKATILFHIVLVVMQILILRKAFQMKNLLQVVVGVIFGYFTTFSNYLFSFLPTPEHGYYFAEILSGGIGNAWLSRSRNHHSSSAGRFGTWSHYRMVWRKTR